MKMECNKKMNRLDGGKTEKKLKEVRFSHSASEMQIAGELIEMSFFSQLKIVPIVYAQHSGAVFALSLTIASIAHFICVPMHVRRATK